MWLNLFLLFFDLQLDDCLKKPIAEAFADYARGIGNVKTLQALFKPYRAILEIIYGSLSDKATEKRTCKSLVLQFEASCAKIYDIQSILFICDGFQAMAECLMNYVKLEEDLPKQAYNEFCKKLILVYAAKPEVLGVVKIFASHLPAEFRRQLYVQFTSSYPILNEEMLQPHFSQGIEAW